MPRAATTSSRTCRRCAGGSSSTSRSPRRHRQLKLGRGGLRDVEFSVQLLQLVHGRGDPSLRSATTLEGLSALAKGGYIGREDALTLGEAYRLLRTLEHRIQLYRLRRTHLMPTSETELRRLGRAIGLRVTPAKEVVELRASRSREVRRIHERLFYRPLLNAAAKLTSADTSLTPEAARARLAALGFRDPAGAMRHLESLTSGVTRRAAIQRTLLPVMLGWFADEADPDAGLLAFRRVSEELGTIHWYLKMLRDEGSSAERLARTLGRSRYAADLLVRSPESVAILGEPGGLTPRAQEQLRLTLGSAAGRRPDADAATASVMQLRRHELLRIAIADLAHEIDLAAGRPLAVRPHRGDPPRRPRDRRAQGRGAGRVTARHRHGGHRDGQPRRPRDGVCLGRRRDLRAPGHR